MEIKKHRTIREMLDFYMGEVENAIKTNMETYGRNASGRSVRSLKRVIESDEYAHLDGLSSFLVMERGRKGGRVPLDFRGIIRQWIIDKGITVRPKPYKRNLKRMRYSPYERGLNSLAGAIAYKIMTSGTRLHRQQGFDDIFTTAINTQMPLLSEELAMWAGTEIDKIHQEEIKI